MINESVVAYMGSMICVHSKYLSSKSVREIEMALRVPNPDFTRRQKMKLWIGDTPRYIVPVCYDAHDSVLLPRGAVDVLRGVVHITGRSLVLRDNRVTHKPREYHVNVEPRDYQIRLASTLCAHGNGCIVVPCGGGKTVIGLLAIVMAKQPTLIIVHTRDLAHQWSDAISNMMGIEAGMIHGGKYKIRDITVATIQSLTRMSGRDPHEIGLQFGAVIIDEAHHVPASTFSRVLSHMPAKYMFGLTATPERADGLTPLLKMYIGPILGGVEHRDLIADGYLVKPHVEVVDTGIAPDDSNYSDMIKTLTWNASRNEIILGIAAKEAAAGKSVLVLSGRVEHCRFLARMMNVMKVRAKALTGITPKTKRKAILEQFRGGEIQVVCATSLADEGLDVARLECVILATPNRSKGRTIQRLGRLMRPLDGKGQPVLYDLVDDAPMAKYQHYARRRAYASCRCAVT